jgi:hypothetical protein
MRCRSGLSLWSMDYLYVHPYLTGRVGWCGQAMTTLKLKMSAKKPPLSMLMSAIQALTPAEIIDAILQKEAETGGGGTAAPLSVGLSSVSRRFPVGTPSMHAPLNDSGNPGVRGVSYGGANGTRLRQALSAVVPVPAPAGEAVRTHHEVYGEIPLDAKTVPAPPVKPALQILPSQCSYYLRSVAINVTSLQSRRCCVSGREGSACIMACPSLHGTQRIYAGKGVRTWTTLPVRHAVYTQGWCTLLS